MLSARLVFGVVACVLFCAGCGDDEGVDADRLGVGAECETDTDCAEPLPDGGMPLRCLTQFKGGYCGLQNCTSHDGCPVGSACVVHDDGERYCFRTCTDKPGCNVNRMLDNESNCSSTVTYVDDDKSLGKACVPPSGN